MQDPSCVSCWGWGDGRRQDYGMPGCEVTGGKESLVVGILHLDNAALLVAVNEPDLLGSFFAASHRFRVLGQLGCQLLDDLWLLIRMISGFIWILLIIVEFVLGRTDGLAWIAPLDQSVTLSPNCSTEEFARIGVKGMIANTGAGILKNRYQADSIDRLGACRRW